MGWFLLAFLALAGVLIVLVWNQENRDKEDSDLSTRQSPTPEEEAADNPIKFQIYQDKGKKYRWRLLNNEDIVGSSAEAWPHSVEGLAECVSEINAIKAGAHNAEVLDNTI